MPIVPSIVHPKHIRIVKRKSQVAVLLIAFTLITSHFSLIYSISPLDKAQEDYSYQVSKYVEAKDKYENAKSSFLTFKTIASKNDATQKTKEYLFQIDNVYKAYLFLVEERSNTINWEFASISKNDLHQQIKQEIEYFNNNQKEIDTTITLEQLPQIAKNIQTRVETKTLQIAFNTLTATDLAQIEYASALFHSNSKIVDNFISTRVKDKQVYLNWKAEIDTIQNNLNNELETLKSKPKETVSLNAKNPHFAYDTQTSTNILFTTKNILREILKFI